MIIGIRRKRWAIVRDGKDIFCGTARNDQLKPISELGNAAVKTYLSKSKAISAFESSWRDEWDDSRYQAVKIVESIEAYD